MVSTNLTLALSMLRPPVLLAPSFPVVHAKASRDRCKRLGTDKNRVFYLHKLGRRFSFASGDDGEGVAGLVRQITWFVVVCDVMDRKSIL